MGGKGGKGELAGKGRGKAGEQGEGKGAGTYERLLVRAPIAGRAG